MKNDKTTKTRIASFEIVSVDGDWKESTARWHKTADACRGVANLFWQTWVAWHFQNDSYSLLKAWLDARNEKGIKAAGKCPVQAYPAEVGSRIYAVASDRFPELARGEIVLVIRRLKQGLCSRKAAKGSLPGWSAILLHHESHPSFTKSFPILFDRGNTKTIIEPPTSKEEDWHVTLSVSRTEDDAGRGRQYVDRLKIQTKGKKVQSQVEILRRIANGTNALMRLEREIDEEYKQKTADIQPGPEELDKLKSTRSADRAVARTAVKSTNYAFCGSQMVYSRSKGKWFLKLCYEMPAVKPEPLDESRVAVLRAEENRPWRLSLPDDKSRMPGGNGLYIGPVRKSLFAHRRNRRANYKNAGSANKGHGRERAGAGPQWKLQQEWKNFVKRVNSGVVREVIEACVANGCGTLVYEQPGGDFRDTRFLSVTGKDESLKESSAWDWFQVRTMLEQRATSEGVTVKIVKFEGSGDAENTDRSRSDAKRVKGNSCGNKTGKSRSKKCKTSAKPADRSNGKTEQ